MSRRLMLRNVSGGEFEPYVLTTPFTFTEHGVWYLTPIDSSEGAPGDPICIGINDAFPGRPSNGWILGNTTRKFKFEFLADGTLNIYSPLINQYYRELSVSYSGVNYFMMLIGWSSPGKAKRYRVDIDESRWGVV